MHETPERRSGHGEYGVLSLLVLLAVALAACYGSARLPCANDDFGWGVQIEFKREGSGKVIQAVIFQDGATTNAPRL